MEGIGLKGTVLSVTSFIVFRESFDSTITTDEERSFCWEFFVSGFRVGELIRDSDMSVTLSECLKL